MTIFTATRTAMAAWCVLSLAPSSLMADTGRIRADVRYRDNTVAPVERLDGKITLRLETIAGPLSFDVGQIIRLTLDDLDPENVLLESTAGDRWVGTVTLRPLHRRLPMLRDGETDIQVRQIDFHQNTPPDFPECLNTRVALQDGSIIRIDASQTEIVLSHEQGEWTVPVASADAFSFAAGDDNLVGAAWFSGSHVFLRGDLTTHALTTQDRFGRSLVIPFDEIKGIRTLLPVTLAHPDGGGNVPAETTSATGGGTWQQHETVTLHERRASEAQTTRIATTVWPLDSAGGRLPIPSPWVDQVLNDPLSGRSLLRTVAGESFRGSLRNTTLNRLDETDAGTSRWIALEAVDRLAYQRPDVTLGDGWSSWRLVSGDVFYGRFAETEIPVERPGRRRSDVIETAELRGAFRHEETGAWILETRTGTLPLQSRSREVDVLLAINGMRITLRWDTVERIASERIEQLPPSTAVSRDRTFLQDAVRIDGGEFIIGRRSGEGMPDEIPPIKVEVPSFIMDVAPVTRDQFAAFVRDTDYETDAERANAQRTWRNPGFPQRNNEPVVFVTWYDAAQFCNWRSRQAGLDTVYEFPRRDDNVITHRHRNGFRLPTEAEWEYAARAGGRNQKYPWGDADDPETLKRSAHFRQPDNPEAWPWTTPVKQFPPNDLGLYDMAGNVWEWCEDWYFDQAYQTVFRLQPFHPLVQGDSLPGLTRRVIRGGSFRNIADLLRCASRGHGLPGQSANRVGFRTVRNLPAAP